MPSDKQAKRELASKDEWGVEIPDGADVEATIEARRRIRAILARKYDGEVNDENEGA